MPYIPLYSSGADRWLKCTSAPALEAKIPNKPGSDYATEGNVAHELAAIELELLFEKITVETYKKKILKVQSSEYYNKEMIDYVEGYVDYIYEVVQGYKKAHPSIEVSIESKFSLVKYGVNSKPTIDFCIKSYKKITIIDLKYGQGKIVVSNKDNNQLKLYGLAALDYYKGKNHVETVEMTIYQPRLNHVSSHVVKASDLTNFGENTLKPTVNNILKGDTVFSPGNNCKWCKVKPQCKALKEWSFDILKHDFANADLLTIEEITEVYTKASVIKDWLKSIEEHMIYKATRGTKWPGFKVVPGKSNRSWAEDQEDIIGELELLGYIEKDITIKKILTPRKMSEVIGLDNMHAIKHLIKKPLGKPTLVPESDPRSTYADIQAANDFS